MRSSRRAIGLTCLAISLSWLLSPLSVPAEAPRSPAPAGSVAPSSRPAHVTPAVRATVSAPPREQRPEEAVARKLETIVPTIDFNAVPLGEVVGFLRTRGQLTIVVNWDALAGSDVDQDTRVTAQLRNVTLKMALRTVIRSIGAFNDPLGYAVVGGTVRISTQAELSKITEIRVYNCQDLIQQPLTADHRQVMEAVIRERLVGAGHLSFEHALATTMDDLRKQAAQDLIGLIETNVEPGTWEPQGTIGSVSEFGGLIIVRHNTQAQEGVADLLAMLREAKAAQSRAATEAE